MDKNNIFCNYFSIFAKKVKLILKKTKSFIIRKKLFSTVFSILLFIFILILSIPTDISKLSERESIVILDKNNNFLGAYLNNKDNWCITNNDKEIPAKLKKAVLSFEDKYFYIHPGINPISLIRALYLNIKEGNIVSGGSTITMQLARIIGNRKRTYFNKFIEILQALKLELLFSKNKILKMYLSYAPYGGNIYGYRTASLRYFGKEPEMLTWAEAATLAVLPNSPGLISPQSSSELLCNKRNKLLKFLFEHGEIDESTYKLALIENIPFVNNSFSVTAPQFCYMVKRNFEKNIKKHSTKTIKTTLDLNLQELVESIVSHHKEILQVSGINNISVIIVETETGKIRVWVGSQDFQDKKTQGEIDGVLSPRSTGSLLKPFLYSLSIDRGFILPDTILRDIPSTFGNYSPMNANGTFMGVVTAKQALINSLNVPSVRLLSMFGVDEFYDFLKKAGLNHLWRTSEDYGLPLILGGAEASPYEIATLYYGLANGGNFSEISWLESKKRVSGKNLISKGSAYLILNVLRELKRPGLEELWNFFSSSKPIAWKTGTSYGYKDAWAAGVTPSWVVVVWSGNFDGTPNPLLSGAKVAGSIMIDIINALPIVSNKKWFEYPKNDLVTIEVCAETGYAPGPNCPRKMVEAPVNMIPLRLCPFHKVIYTTLDGKYSVCSSCWEPGNYVQKVMLIWPPDIAQYLRENGVLYSEPPPHKPECKSVNSDQIEIIYPQNGNKIVIPRDFNGQYQKVVFRAATSSKKTSLYWYIDGELIGTTSGYHLLAFLPEPGVHKITIVEKESGQVSSVTFTSILAK